HGGDELERAEIGGQSSQLGRCAAIEPALDIAKDLHHYAAIYTAVERKAMRPIRQRLCRSSTKNGRIYPPVRRNSVSRTTYPFASFALVLTVIDRGMHFKDRALPGSLSRRLHRAPGGIILR